MCSLSVEDIYYRLSPSTLKYALARTRTRYTRTHSEVRQSLTNAQQQYSQWCMLLDSDVDPEKLQGIGSELKNLIKSIEWDLEDLDQTISILSDLVLPLPSPT